MAFWKTLGKIGAIAAPLIAAPFTGGASLAALGALSGAAGARLSGRGLKGTLLGAGFGAIPGLSGVGKVAGAATPGLRQGLTQVGRSAIGLGPSTASHVGSEVANVANAVQAVQGPSRLANVGNVLKHLLPMVGGGGGGGGGVNPYGDLGTTASGAAKGSADQRLAEADALTRRYAQSLRGAGDQVNADLAAAEFKRVEEARAFERALIRQQLERGPLAMAPYVSGNFTPSTPTSPNQPGEANAALMAQLAPLQQIEVQAYRPPGVPGVNAEGIPIDLQQGRGEKILGGVGLGTKLLGSVLGNFGRGAGTGPDRGTNLPRFPQVPWDTGTPHLDMDTLRAAGLTGAPYGASPPRGLGELGLPAAPYGASPPPPPRPLGELGLPAAPYGASPPPPPRPGRVTTRETPRVATPPPTVQPDLPTYGGRDVSGILGRSPQYWTHTGRGFDPRTGERLDPPQTRYNEMIGETVQEAARNPGTFLNRMRPGGDLSPQQRQQMLAANEAVKKLAIGALAIPAAGMAAWAAGARALAFLGRITPQFIDTASGAQAQATLSALQRMLPSLSDNPRRHAIRQIVELSRKVGGGP